MRQTMTKEGGDRNSSECAVSFFLVLPNGVEHGHNMHSNNKVDRKSVV